MSLKQITFFSYEDDIKKRKHFFFPFFFHFFKFTIRFIMLYILIIIVAKII